MNKTIIITSGIVGTVALIGVVALIYFSPYQTCVRATTASVREEAALEFAGAQSVQQVGDAVDAQKEARRTAEVSCARHGGISN